MRPELGGAYSGPFMDWFLLTAAGVALFLARDAALLASAPVAPLPMRAAWAAVQGVLFLGLGLAAESISRDQAYAILRDPRFWMPAVAIHFALWAAIYFGRRHTAFARGVWLIALIPSPVPMFCGGACVWIALTRTGALEGWSAGVAVGAAWIGTVLASAARFRPAADAALQFAATSNLSAILLIPIQQQSGEGSGVAEQPIDWIAALLPLALTGSLVLLSYLFHRHRSGRRSA